jgi:hypothetical protein
MRTVPAGTVRVKVTGARERLARTLASLPDEYLFERLAALLERNANFGDAYPERRKSVNARA